MSYIIQDFNKIINSRLSHNLFLYLVSVMAIITSFFVGRASNIIDNRGSVTFVQSEENLSYEEENENNINQKVSQDKIIFGSKKGKYFYYDWCGSASISKANLVYYKNEEEAKSMGKILHTKCE